MFLIIILGATDRRAPQGFAPIAIGLGLTLIHLIGIPVTNLSENNQICSIAQPPTNTAGPMLRAGFTGLRRLRELRWRGWFTRCLRVNRRRRGGRRLEKARADPRRPARGPAADQGVHPTGGMLFVRVVVATREAGA